MAGQNHQLGVAAGQRQFGLHLRDGAPFRQPHLGEVALLGSGQDVEIIEAVAHEIVVLVAAQLQEALVDPHVAEVGDPDDHRGRGVGVEHALEALLGLHRRGDVADHQRETARCAASRG